MIGIYSYLPVLDSEFSSFLIETFGPANYTYLGSSKRNFIQYNMIAI